MTTAPWLAVRELVVRRGRAALACAVIAAIAATVTATELVARAREEAVAAQIDAMGPALTVVPRGTSTGELARYELGEAALPASAEAAVRAALGRDLRAIERRLVVHRELAGTRVPVVGVAADALPMPLHGPDSVALGSELARRLGNEAGVALDGRELRVEGVLPSTGGVEDLGLFLPLAAAQALAGVEGVNELRLSLRAGVSSRGAEARLTRASLGAAVIRSDRGDVADREAQESLSRHRGSAYAVMAAVAALCLVIAAHLDAAERRVELATLVALGASRRTVLGALLFRSALLAAAGSALGAAGGAALAAAQDPAVAAALARAWSLCVATVGAAVAVGVAAAIPTALATIARDPVRELQEG
ncbi:FtsX-like permease family protein [Anaeromyxobacter terrae]|uniref:FtsX-like permease family protein n=1 Tax=Anaeromyxobacter terrae TaxID=2925406 RepID=UPI001F5A5E75|nr:FtsX-like permease family protein [Anaeromyxobacter sp. SG22]